MYTTKRVFCFFFHNNFSDSKNQWGYRDVARKIQSTINKIFIVIPPLLVPEKLIIYRELKVYRCRYIIHVILLAMSIKISRLLYIQKAAIKVTPLPLITHQTAVQLSRSIHKLSRHPFTRALRQVFVTWAKKLKGGGGGGSLNPPTDGVARFLTQHTVIQQKKILECTHTHTYYL